MRYFLLALCSWAAAAGTSHAQAPADGGSRPAGNPLEFSIANIKRGKQLYTVHCVRCHGVDGRGDTEMREFLKTAPVDLSDDQWIYGSDDDVVFEVIEQGRTPRDMPGFGAELSEERIWQVISYLEFLGGRRP